MVSGTISLPSRGTFHHSLTVLIHYRSAGSIQAYQVVLADSHKIPRASCYSGYTHRPAERITTTGLPPSPVTHSNVFVYTPAPQPPGLVDPGRNVPQPRARNPYQVSHAHGLAPSAFARHYSRNHSCFLFLSVLRCFTSRRSLQPAYTFSRRSHTITACGVSPFGNPGINARLSTPPGLSQIPTSFIGSCCQGIHHAPFNTYTQVFNQGQHNTTTTTQQGHDNDAMLDHVSH